MAGAAPRVDRRRLGDMSPLRRPHEQPSSRPSVSRARGIGGTLIFTPANGQLLTMHPRVTTANVKPPPMVALDTCVLSAKRDAIASVAPFSCDATTAPAPLLRLLAGYPARSSRERMDAAVAETSRDPHSAAPA